MNKILLIIVLMSGICSPVYADNWDEQDIDRQIFLNQRAQDRLEDLQEYRRIPYRIRQDLEDIDRDLELDFQQLTD